ncbi:MAG: CPBP family intramembrane glutamic endopeptidase [Rhodothermaceae bacterium]
MLSFFSSEIKNFKNLVVKTDKNILIILISIPLITTISWYYTSRTFFKVNIYPYIVETVTNLELTEILYWLVSDSVTCLVFPCLILLLLREKISGYGMNFSNWKTGWKYVLTALVFIIPVLWIISSFGAFINYYPTVSESRDNLSVFLVYQLGLIIYLFAWEFLWRGYLLFGLEKKFGFYSIFIQLIPFVLLHNGKPLLETVSAIAGGILLGYIALRTRSFIYGFLIHLMLISGIEIISLLRYQNNEYGIGFNAIINILL